MMRVCDDGLGFSLKPPKWLSKMQPGKALVAAITAPAKLFGAAPKGTSIYSIAPRLVRNATSSVVSQVRNAIAPITGGDVQPPHGTAAPMPPMIGPPMLGPPMVAPSGGSSMSPQNYATPTVPEPAGASAEAAAGAVPDWLIPAGVALALFLFMRRR